MSSGGGSGSTSSSGSSPHHSDLYFDDEFDSARIMSRDRHLRLQTTLGLDRPAAAMNLSDEFRSPQVMRGRAQPQLTTAGHKLSTSVTTTTGQMMYAGEGATSLAEGNGSCGKYLPLLAGWHFCLQPSRKCGLMGVPDSPEFFCT